MGKFHIGINDKFEKVSVESFLEVQVPSKEIVYIDRPVEIIKEVFIEKQVPVEVIVEKIIEKEVPRIMIEYKTVEVPVIYENKIIEKVEVPVYIEKEVSKIIDINDTLELKQANREIKKLKTALLLTIITCAMIMMVI